MEIITHILFIWKETSINIEVSATQKKITTTTKQKQNRKTNMYAVGPRGFPVVIQLSYKNNSRHSTQDIFVFKDLLQNSVLRLSFHVLTNHKYTILKKCDSELIAI